MRRLPPDTRPGKGYYAARSVGAFVPKLAAAAFERFGFHSAEIMTSWPTIVGADLARLTRPEAIRWPRGGRSKPDAMEDGTGNSGATLIVACDPASALEVSYRTHDIVDRINRYFGYRAIAQLKVLQSPRMAETPEPSPSPTRPPAPTPIAAAGGDLSAALEALGASVAAAKTGPAGLGR
jgi:hypothetical protein